MEDRLNNLIQGALEITKHSTIVLKVEGWPAVTAFYIYSSGGSYNLCNSIQKNLSGEG